VETGSRQENQRRSMYEVFADGNLITLSLLLIPLIMVVKNQCDDVVEAY
jgi:hypothetical protein